MSEWPHSPAHKLEDAGAYMVTAGIYRRERFLHTAERLSLAHDALLHLALHYEWRLQAWAVLANHYHFVAIAPDRGGSGLRIFIQHLHSFTSRKLNELDKTPGRKVWFQYWDSHITFPASYFARLKYVHNNAVHHGLVAEPSNYQWCSAPWFSRRADPAFFRTVMRFKIDALNIRDDF